MIEYVESPKSEEASAIPTLTPGGSYYDPVSETYVPGIKVTVDIGGLGVVEDAIVENIEQGFGSSANICSFLLPRSFDDYGQVDTDKGVIVKVNNRLLFNGKIRSIYPAQTDRGEMVRVNASDKRVEMQEIPFEKDGEYRIIYNPRPTTIVGKPGEWVSYAKVGHTSCGGILHDIRASCGILIETVSEAFSDFDPGEITFTDMNCAEAIDLLTQRAGNFRWWLTPEDRLVIHPMGMGNERVAYLGEEGELAGNFNVSSAELSKSVSNLVRKVIFIGGKSEIETSAVLGSGWGILHQKDWNLDNKDEEGYRDVYRKYIIPEPEDVVLMSKLITFPYLGPIVYSPDPDKPWKVLEGYSIDYEEKMVIFSSPQYRISNMETGEVEPIPIMMIYAKYGDPMEITVSSGFPSGATRIMRDESYIHQSVLSDIIDFEIYHAAPKVLPRNDTDLAQQLAQAELNRYAIPDIRGSIEMVGDETINVIQRISLLNAIGEHAEEYANLKGSIVRLAHNLSKGYTVSMEITNERPRMGMPPRRILPEIKYSLDKDRDEIRKTGELLPRKDAIPKGHHPHQHKKPEEDGLAYAVYAPEEEEKEEE